MGKRKDPMSPASPQSPFPSGISGLEEEKVEPRESEVEQGASSNEIRADIEQTRAEMDETLEDLEEKLHPMRLIDQVLDLFQGGDRGETLQSIQDIGSRAGRKLKQHPVPSLLLGVGIIWLFLEDPNKPISLSRHRTHGGGETGLGEKGHEPVRQAQDKVGRSTESGWDSAAKAGETREKDDDPKEALQEVGQKIQSAAVDVSHKFSDETAKVGKKIRHAYTSGQKMISDVIEDYPLAAGGAVLALGVIAGLVTRRGRTSSDSIVR